MPVAPLRRCTSPGCPTPVVTGRCDKHRRLAGRQRDTWTDLYGRGWQRRRLQYLSEHPQCALCPRMAVIADHYPVGIRRLIAMQVPDPHADRRLRPLCWSCHSKETAKHQPGGFRVNQR